jgi:ABC-type Mn2+/Zn2+ transport system permease subunit
MMLVAVAMGALAVVGGLYVSYYAGTAAGATMATLSVVLFFVVLAVRGLVTE